MLSRVCVSGTDSYIVKLHSSMYCFTSIYVSRGSLMFVFSCWMMISCCLLTKTLSSCLPRVRYGRALRLISLWSSDRLNQSSIDKSVYHTGSQSVPMCFVTHVTGELTVWRKLSAPNQALAENFQARKIILYLQKSSQRRSEAV